MSRECDIRFSHKNSTNSAKHSKSRGEGRGRFCDMKRGERRRERLRNQRKGPSKEMILQP
jgi:hypothetical protein